MQREYTPKGLEMQQIDCWNINF